MLQSVLGLVKVIIVRLPGDELQKHLRGIVEGLLLWSDDSKNHFKAKVISSLDHLLADTLQISRGGCNVLTIVVDVFRFGR